MAGLTTALGLATLGAATVYQGKQAEKAAESAANAQREAAEKGISEQRLARESFEERTDPFRIAGQAAISPLLQELGINVPQELVVPENVQGQGQPIDDRTTRLFDFLSNRGQRQIEESAAASGRLRSGGTLEDLTEFQSNLANQFAVDQSQRRFNNLFNLVGLGSNVSAGQGTSALNTASNISNLLGSSGNAQVGGILGAQQARSNTVNQLSGLLGYGVQGGFSGAQSIPQTSLPAPTNQQIFL